MASAKPLKVVKIVKNFDGRAFTTVCKVAFRENVVETLVTAMYERGKILIRLAKRGLGLEREQR
jgi:hypothetical protein